MKKNAAIIIPFIISSVLLTVLVSGLIKRGQNKLALPLTCPEWISIIRECKPSVVA